MKLRYLSIGLTLGLAACSQAPIITPLLSANPKPVVRPAPLPDAVPPVSASLEHPTPVIEAKPNSNLMVETTVISPVTLEPIQPPLATAPNTFTNEAQGRAVLLQVLPRQIKDRQGWANDIFTAFSALKIPYEATYFCAALSVIEQESSWQSDPVVPNLDKIVWQQIENRASKYHIPMVAIQLAFLKSSPDGRSYKTRIDSLRTEKQMNALFEDMVADAKSLGLPVDMKNPIRTGGPMQVSVDFAERHVKVWPYPYRYQGSLRREVFSRRGGLYFGIADLLQYRANYPQMLYRFADYNAGRYSSRNAAFQSALAVITKNKIVLDGDLLSYDKNETSNTQQLLLQIAPRLGVSAATIERDLQLEKSEAFAQTAVFKKVFEVAQQRAGHALPQQILPDIRLLSPKITRKLTTAWFAQRVNERYQQCLARVPTPVANP